MAEIINIKNEAGEVQYPVTKPECVIDENGKNVLQLIRENGGGSTPDLSGYLTKEEFNKASEDFATTDALEGKQDTIEDLNSIRSGAEKGATAVQPSILEDYATTQQLTELSSEVGKKVDADKVATINGQSLVQGGNITIEGGKGEKGDKGDKGDQGNSGYTGAADELEVVNNLTQGGATAALSAEMGKVLSEKVDNLDISDITGTSKMVAIEPIEVIDGQYVKFTANNNVVGYNTNMAHEVKIWDVADFVGKRIEVTTHNQYSYNYWLDADKKVLYDLGQFSGTKETFVFEGARYLCVSNVKANGEASFEVRQASLADTLDGVCVMTNLLNGEENINVVNCQLTTENGVLRIVPTATPSVGNININAASLSCKEGDVLYARMKLLKAENFKTFRVVFNNGTNVQGDYISVDDGDNNYRNIAFPMNISSNVVVGAKTLPNRVNQIAFAFEAKSRDSYAELDAKAIVLNLTSIFGKGFEPNHSTLDAIFDTANVEDMNITDAKILLNAIGSLPKNGAYIRVTEEGNVEMASVINPNWANWQNKAFTYGMSKEKSPMYHMVHGPIETDAMFSVFAKYGRWSGLVNGGQFWGGHVFEGWNNLRTSRETMMIGNNGEDEGALIIYRPGGVESQANIDAGITDNGGKYGLVRVGADFISEGFLFNNREMVAYGDINFDKIGTGVVLTSPDNTKWRLTIGNDGTVSATKLPTYSSIADLFKWHTCMSAASASEKIVAEKYRIYGTDTDEEKTKKTKVKFLYKNTASDVTIKILRRGREIITRPLYYNGSPVSASNTWDDNSIVEVTWDDNAAYATVL